MGILDKLFTKLTKRFRIVVVFENDTRYALSGNSPLRMAGYLMSYFKDGKEPVNGWRLYFGSNATKKHFLLTKKHFTGDGDNVTASLLQDLDDMDKRWRGANGPELEFENIKTRNKINMQIQKTNDIRKMMDDIYSSNRSGETGEDWYSVMGEVFGE